MKHNTIMFYGTPWCGDCLRAKNVLDQKHIAYDFIDISTDPAEAAKVEQLNKGMRSVPTIVFPDGSILVEPGSRELENKISALI